MVWCGVNIYLIFITILIIILPKCDGFISANPLSCFLHRCPYRSDNSANLWVPSRLSFLRMQDDTYGLIKDSLYRYIELKSRPPYIGIPRNRLALQFAVQMMRSSYNTVDDLDFTPMDMFQKVFFLFRQSEWEDYKRYHTTVLQGDLSDPLYFDFISFCQYAVISDKIKNGQYEFFERVGADGELQRVTRNNSILNENLAKAHSDLVGDKLLEFMVTTYPQLPSIQNLPQGSKDFTRFESAAQDLLDMMAVNAFAVNPSISFVSTATTNSNSRIYKVALKAPANLWSQQVLRYRKDKPVNDFENKILAAMARRLGFQYDVLSTDVVNGIDVIHIVKINA